MKFEILPEIQDLKILPKPKMQSDKIFPISEFRRKGLKDVKYWLGLREIITVLV